MNMAGLRISLGLTTPTNFNLLPWNPATATARPVSGSANNGGSNVWTSANGGPISGISTAAQWIWGPDNGAALGTSDVAENFIWAANGDYNRPPPSRLRFIVWSLLGAGSWLGMRVWRRGRRVGRQPWSDENRQAIHEIIACGVNR